MKISVIRRRCKTGREVRRLSLPSYSNPGASISASVLNDERCSPFHYRRSLSEPRFSASALETPDFSDQQRFVMKMTHVTSTSWLSELATVRNLAAALSACAAVSASILMLIG